MVDDETQPHPPGAATSGGEYRPRRRGSTPTRPWPTPITAPSCRVCQSSSKSSSRRRRPRPRPECARRTAGILAAMIVVGSGVAVPAEFSPSSHAADGGERSSPIIAVDLPPNGATRRRALVNDPPNLRSTKGCAPGQHTLLLTLYTDAHSILDNSWVISHASHGYGRETGNSGTHVESESVATGNLGYGAVLMHAVCADRSTALEEVAGVGVTPLVESCYDLELRDANGDGLTAPHSAQGGLAGGFSLKIDGTVVAEHRGRACLSDDKKEWNECAVKRGFKYCGLRLCVTSDGRGKATLSNLSGSQCSLAQPQCDAESTMKSPPSLVAVNVDTDSFSQELSWEVRKSSKSDSRKIRHAARNDLLLAGGMPVRHDDTDTVLLGHDGVGVPLADNESFENVACLPGADAKRSCFDLRAYDEYGDGVGCGADGSLSLSVQTPGRGDDGKPVLERVMLTQRDDDMAKWQQVKGKKRLACMNKKKLSKWTYCAVRVCADGDVIGLEGNQCDFGHGEDLIDGRYAGADPLMGLKMKPQGGKEWPGDEEEEGEHAVVVPTEDVQLNIINAFNAEGKEKDKETWADYYEKLGPDFRPEDDNPKVVSSTVGGDVSDTIAAAMANQQNQPLQMGHVGFDFASMKPIDKFDGQKPKKQQQGQKGPRPNQLKKKQGQKGPRPNKDGKDNQENTRPRPDMIPSKKEGIQPFNEQVAGQRQERVELKPFTANLLDIKFPHDFKDSRLSQLSKSVADYLLTYFNGYPRKNDGVPTPTGLKLDCTRFKKKVGPEVRWVMVCGGAAEYQLPPSMSPPSRKALARVIRDAFEGKAMEKFLEVIYDYGKEGKKQEDKKKQTLLEKLKAKEKKRKEMMQQHGTLQGGGGGRSDRNQKKNKNIREKKDAKKQMKLDKLEDKEQLMPQDGELDDMGYVPVTQNMNTPSDSGRGYDIINRDVHIDVYGDNNGVTPGVETVGRNGKNENRQRRRQQRNS